MKYKTKVKFLTVMDKGETEPPLSIVIWVDFQGAGKKFLTDKTDFFRNSCDKTLDKPYIKRSRTESDRKILFKTFFRVILYQTHGYFPSMI